jgi:hypothetical protein
MAQAEVRRFDQGATGDEMAPGLWFRPGQSTEVNSLVFVLAGRGHDGGLDRGQVDQHVADPGGANSQGDGQGDELVRVAAEAGESAGNMYVRCDQDTGTVEGGQHPVGVEARH